MAYSATGSVYRSGYAMTHAMLHERGEPMSNAWMFDMFIMSLDMVDSVSIAIGVGCYVY